MTGKPAPMVYFSVGHKAKRGLFSHANEAQGDRNLAEQDPIRLQARM